MSLENFIPEVWSSRLLTSLKRTLIYAQPAITNRDYEGDIHNVGDTVRINAIGPVTISDYTKNSNLSDPEELNDAQTTLTIEKAKYFNFQIDDVDKAQGSPALMDGAMREAAFGLSNAADQYIAALMAASVPSANTVGTTAAPIDMSTVTNAYDSLVDLSVKLDEANVPVEGRFAAIPPWFEGVLLKDDRFVKYGQNAQNERLVNGFVGRAAGFDLMKTNNAPTGGSTYWYALAGVSMATSFAEQVRKTEAYRPEKRFADAMKGLHLYGGKVVRPEALAVLICQP